MCGIAYQETPLLPEFIRHTMVQAIGGEPIIMFDDCGHARNIFQVGYYIFELKFVLLFQCIRQVANDAVPVGFRHGKKARKTTFPEAKLYKVVV